MSWLIGGTKSVAIGIGNSNKNTHMKTSDLKSFHYLESGDVSFSVMDTIKTQKKLDPGVYRLGYDSNGNVTVKVEDNEESISMYNFENKDILDRMFDKFFDKKLSKRIMDLGFKHKTGILLHGKQGCGKSTIMKHYYKRSVEKNKSIVFHMGTMNPGGFQGHWGFMSRIREIQNNPIVAIADEIDSMFSFGGGDGEGVVKNSLDGTGSIDNCIILAATNYLSKIPDAVTRPSRFKYIIEMKGVEDEEDIFNITFNMLKETMSEEEVRGFSEELKGKTLDEIKHFCIDKIMDLEGDASRIISKEARKVVGF